jgi:hypothetical protein
MAYLKTKAQFDALNSVEKRDVLVAIHSLHSSHIWVSIELRNPPKGILASQVHSTLGVSSHALSEYVRTNNTIAKQVVHDN